MEKKKTMPLIVAHTQLMIFCVMIKAQERIGFLGVLGVESENKVGLYFVSRKDHQI